MTSRIATSIGRFVALGLLVGAAGSCGSDLPSDNPDRAVHATAIADDLVASIVRFYAEEYRDGEVRSYAINSDLVDEIGDPYLESALRRVSDQVSPVDSAEWILEFMRTSSFDSENLVVLAAVVDLTIEHCCHLVLSDVNRGKDGWKLLGIHDGGFGDETVAFREERAKRAKTLK